jgi:hypothetical protein
VFPRPLLLLLRLPGVYTKSNVDCLIGPFGFYEEHELAVAPAAVDWEFGAIPLVWVLIFVDVDGWLYVPLPG